MQKKIQLSKNILKQWSQELGFSSIGIAKADFLEDEAPRLESWLKNGYNGEMQYMNNHFDLRLDPRKLVDGAKSVISLSYNYYTEESQCSDSYKISKYAFGEDYHDVVREKLKAFLSRIQEKIGAINGRVFVDSAPIMERTWAVKSGIGWIGKHSLLINKKQGSFFFLAEIILDVELEYDAPFLTNHCGTCTACIDACPTDAIVEDKIVDATKCISYLTIELTTEIPVDFKNKLDDWMFGCDICQDVCPWNRFSIQHNEPKFLPKNEILNTTKKEWKELTNEVFNEVFRKSAVKRTKFEGLIRNINFLATK